jgi:hypothetical protein
MHSLQYKLKTVPYRIILIVRSSSLPSGKYAGGLKGNVDFFASCNFKPSQVQNVNDYPVFCPCNQI